MKYTLREAGRYASVAARIVVLAALRKFGIRTEAVDDFDEQTVLRAFDLSLAFEPVEIGQPKGWYCEHISITGSGFVGKPTAWCGCAMLPLAEATL